MGNSLRLGIIGAGRIAAASHLPAALAVPGIDLVALVDPVEARARELAKASLVSPRIASNLEAVLGDVDALVIATPNHTHAKIATAALTQGVHVLIEKPLANTVAEGEAIAEAASLGGATVAVGYCTRFLDSVRFMHSLLDRGFFGRIHRFAYQSGVIGGWASASGFHLDRDAAGGGVLVTTGTHFLDRMLWWFGRPECCELDDDSLGGPEANAVAHFRFERDSTSFEGTARFSKTVRLPAGFVMDTERGRVLLREGDSEFIHLRSAEHPDVESPLQEADRAGDSLDMFARQLQDFAAAIRTGRDPLVGVSDGIDCDRLVEQLYADRKPLERRG